MSGPVGAIAAVSPEGVIGKNGTLPWRRPADLKRFKRITMGAAVIMGRLTFESMGRALPGRANWVVSSGPDIEGVQIARSLDEALAAIEGPSFVIGGARLFAEAFAGKVDFIDLSFVPDRVDPSDAVLLPPLDPHRWYAGPLEQNEEDPELWHRRYHPLPR